MSGLGTFAAEHLYSCYSSRPSPGWEQRGKALVICMPQKWVVSKTDSAGTASSLVFMVFCADGEEIFQKPKGNIDLRLLSEDIGHHGELLQILSPGREKAFHLSKGREW